MEELRAAIEADDFETFKALVDSNRFSEESVAICIFDWSKTDDTKWIAYCEPTNFCESGASFLNMAVSNGKLNHALFLLRRGFDVNYRSKVTETTAIEIAYSKQMAKMLIEFGCGPPIKCPKYLIDFVTGVITTRNHTRHCAIITLCALRCRYRDISQIIARLSEFNWED